MAWLRALARAKINLTLDIKARRPDGYHDIESVMHTIGLADEVGVRISDGPSVSLRVMGAKLPEDPRNLAWKAADAALKAIRGKGAGDGRGVDIELFKNIPFEAGLAGGSSDAAAVLYLVNTAFGGLLGDHELSEVASGIGADVPFLLTGGIALATGTGDELTVLDPCMDAPVVLAKPATGLSTALMYRAWDEKHGFMADRVQERESSTRAFLRELAKKGQDGALMCVHNDFEELAVIAVPEISEIKAVMLEEGAAASAMSGSGTSVFGIFNDEQSARKALGALRRARGDIFTAYTRLDPRRQIPMLE